MIFHNVVFELFMPRKAQKLQVCNTQFFQNSIISFQNIKQNMALRSKKIKKSDLNQ